MNTNILPITDTPLRIDAWVASSLMQKAIRRSDTPTAQRAALSFHRARGAAIWRRFQVIAFEDVGAGSVDALAGAAACADPAWRARLGGDHATILHVTKLLADAPKDRSAEHLIRLCRTFAGYEQARNLVGTAPQSSRLEIVADAQQALPIRAIASWFASGLNLDGERRLKGGNLDGVLDALQSSGAPKQLVASTGIAARKTRNPLCLMPVLVWREAQSRTRRDETQEHLPPVPTVGEIPAFALDKFTATGKAAIRSFARENESVRAVLGDSVPEFRAVDAAAMAVFYVEGCLVRRRFDWEGSRSLETLGTEQDLIGVGVPRQSVATLLNAVRANIDHLHDIRARLRSRRSAGR